ncbi:secretion protein EccK [Mycolicibacterium lutetiense]
MSAGGSKSDAASAASAAGAPTSGAGTGAQPTNPLDQFQKGMADAAKASGPPQQMSSTPSQPMGGPPTTQPLNTAPAGTGAPPSPGTMAQSAGGATGAGSAPVSAGPATGAAPSSPMPLGPPPTAPPAAPVPPGAPAPGALGPAVNPASTAAAGGGAQVAPIPVSAARAERDAAAKASRRSSSDPLELARRIAAALNVGTTGPRFMWLTALTNDGTIVVANNYGLGFVPDGVNLPDQVKFASLDESVAAKDRGRSATYPMLALESWAQAHDTQLRAVIALEDQLKGFDSGAATVVLHPDDLPTNGQMQGRSRLMLIAPEVAERLSKVSDAGLMALLPPAPVDPQPPEDRRVKLLMAVFRPLLNSDPGRVAVQLQAMVAYGQHMYEVAMHTAYTATDGPSQREAIADALYWQHVSVLNSDALGEPS